MQPATPAPMRGYLVTKANTCCPDLQRVQVIHPQDQLCHPSVRQCADAQGFLSEAAYGRIIGWQNKRPQTRPACRKRRVWVLLRFKERLVQMAMRRSAIQQARASGKVSTRALNLCGHY